MTSPGLLSRTALLAAGGILAFGAAAAETETTEVTTTIQTMSTSVTQKVKTEKTQWAPLRVCVLDFTSADILGQKRFLDERNKEIKIPPQCTLNDADRKSINSVMQGFVRMIDAWDNTRTNAANRRAQADDNRFDRAKALELYRTVVKGESRPMVIGAEYLTAYLGRHNDVFGCVDAPTVAAAMKQLAAQPDFPQDFLLRLAKATGATHLIYGTVSDLRTRGNTFKGYGIETKTTDYQLDVLIKVVDLAAQHTVYSNVYTGTYREPQGTGLGAPFDNNIFQKLMTAALEQAADDLYEVCKPGRKNQVSPTPMPLTVAVQVTGGMFFKENEAEVYIDGVRVGNGGGTFAAPAGRHRIEIKAAGYRPKQFDIDLQRDMVIHQKLEK